MAMEPIYWALIVVLLVFMILQASTILRLRRAATHWRGAAQRWRRLADDREHHAIGLARINRSIDERETDQ